jgi:uncharacterized OB-fold protein
VSGSVVPGADRDSTPWWAALGRHELTLQRCDGCDAARWPPRAICNRCGSLDWRWAEASGRGTVASWIVNHHSFGSGAGGSGAGGREAPYVVLLVRLDDQDDILIPGAWAGLRDGSDLRVGLPVTVGFDDAAALESGEPVALLRWSPV